MLRIYCPVERQTIIALAGGDASAMERDPTLAKMRGFCAQMDL
jgi:hypothetical protein